MKRVFKVLSVLLCLLVLFNLSGCTQTPEPSSSDVNTNSNNTENETKPSSEPEYEWKYGSIMSKEHPLTVGAQRFADEMNRLTDGRVHITVYPSMQLGSVQEMVEGVQLGSIEFIDTAMANLSGFDTKFYAYNLPFLFYEPDVAYAFLDGELGQEMKGPVGNTGFSVIGYFENGFRNITSNKGPIVLPKDIQGQKIRTMSNVIHLRSFELLGTLPTPMAFGELFTALQQNVVDGQENPLTNILDMSFHEVQDYLTVSGHFYDANTVLVNEKLYNSLPEDIKSAIDEAITIAVKEHRKLTIEENEKIINEWKSSDAFIEINELTPEQKDEWKDIMSGAYEEFRDEIGPEYLDRVVTESNRLHELFYNNELDTSNLY